MNTQVVNNSKHYFGLYGHMSEEFSMLNFGHYLAIHTANESNLVLEIAQDDYQELKGKIAATQLKTGQSFFLELEVDESNFILDWELVELPFDLHYANKLMLASYNRKNTISMFKFIQTLKHKALQSFMWSVLSNYEVAGSFVSIPASKKHHHSYPGGLLDHSLECLRIVTAGLKKLNSQPSITEVDITRIAALLHDVGKVATLTNGDGYRLEGYVMNHESYTLSVIHPELMQLKKTFERAGVALEYLLTWKDSDGFPNFIGATLIKAADRISTASDLKKTAFADKPSYYHFAQFEVGNNLVHLSRLQ